MAVELAPELLEILACPNCHGSLAVDHERDELVCTAPDCQLAYPVRDQIPVLLIDEARPPYRPGADQSEQSESGQATDEESEGGAEPEAAETAKGEAAKGEATEPAKGEAAEAAKGEAAEAAKDEGGATENKSE